MKKFFLFVAALSVCAQAAEGTLDERLDGLAAQVERVMAKAGIHFSGEFRSQFLNSHVHGNALNGFGKVSESAEYTSVDFDIVARPNTYLSARAVFRLHQDWRNFFSDVQNPIVSRWLSVDGKAMQGIFSYNLGDYRKKLTPLTLWSPDIELLYEPEIIGQGRKLAMSEAFLGENNRVLQGANFEFKAELGTESGTTILNEIGADVFGARLATRGDGESAPIAWGVSTTPNGAYWDAVYDKYLVGANIGTQIVKGAGLGATYLSVFDNTGSYRIDSYKGMADAFEDSAKFNSSSNNIFAARLNFGNKAFMDDDFVSFGINGELALSTYNYHNEYDSTVLKGQKSDGSDSAKYNVAERSIKGQAVNAGLFVKLNLNETNRLGISADYILNDSAFINVVAQSPSFAQRAIMNSEQKDMSANLGLLNPFDAMYRSIFKYVPSQYFSESKPFTKTSYTNVIFTKTGLDSLASRRDSVFNVFQDALPGGLATADRTGPVIKLDGSFLDNGITIGAKAALLKSVTEMPKGDIIFEVARDTLLDGDGNPKFDPEWGGVGGNPYVDRSVVTKPYDAFSTDYQEIVFGASVDIAKFVPVVGPSLELGGSYGMYSVKHGDLGSSESALLSAFLNYNFYTRFSLLFGYQQLGTSVKKFANTKEESYKGQYKSVKSWDFVTDEYAFDNLAVGFGYKVADGSALTVKLTRVSGEGPVVERKTTDTSEKTTVTRETVKKDYITLQPEVFLTVRF
jgi:hypothetical protein